MFFQNHKKQVKIDRESVCMADDCMAPNEKVFTVKEKEKLLDVFWRIAEYLPRMSNAVWAVDSGTNVLGYIIMDADIRFELCQENQIFSELGIEALHCSYFCDGRFLCRNSADGKMEEKYPESGTLLGKAKCYMRERFQEELKIKSGSVCIWGEWFGRPYDNLHTVESICWEKDKLTIDFNGGESLYISSPADIVNEENHLMIGDAERVLWVWYSYEKEHTYENLYVRQYTKSGDGSILRAEGKRRDVKDGDGTIFHARGENAVWIG